MILVTVVDSHDNYDEFFIPNEYESDLYTYLNLLPRYEKVN